MYQRLHISDHHQRLQSLFCKRYFAVHFQSKIAHSFHNRTTTTVPRQNKRTSSARRRRLCANHDVTQESSPDSFVCARYRAITLQKTHTFSCFSNHRWLSFLSLFRNHRRIETVIESAVSSKVQC